MQGEAFEVVSEYRPHDDRTLVGWRSRAFNCSQYIEVHRRWDADPRALARFIEELVGVPLNAFYRARVRSGEEMVRALMPHFEYEIHNYMERMEYEARYWHRPARHDRMDALRYGMLHGRYEPFFAPPEDPKAKQKARDLLIRNLDAGQEKSFKKDGEFRVTAKGGKAYTIKTARSFNVVAEDGTKYCGQLADTPVEDQMLAQKLLLEHDPDKFFKNANVSPAMTATTGNEMAMQDAIRYGMGTWSI